MGWKIVNSHKNIFRDTHPMTEVNLWFHTHIIGAPKEENWGMPLENVPVMNNVFNIHSVSEIDQEYREGRVPVLTDFPGCKEEWISRSL